MVTTLKTSEKKGGNRGSKSVTSLYSFFSAKVYFTPGIHPSPPSWAAGANYIFSFSSITAILHVKHFKRSVMKCPLNKGSRSYSTNSSPTTPSFQPVKVYLNADEDKLIILKENKGKCGVYR